MWEIIVFGIVIVFACMGLGEFIHCVHIAILSSGFKKKTFSVVLLQGEDAIRQLVSFASQSKWLGRSMSEYKIAAYGDMPQEQFLACKKIAEKYDIIYCPKETVEHIMCSLSQ